jgi:hypothetical protein
VFNVGLPSGEGDQPAFAFPPPPSSGFRPWVEALPAASLAAAHALYRNSPPAAAAVSVSPPSSAWGATAATSSTAAAPKPGAAKKENKKERSDKGKGTVRGAPAPATVPASTPAPLAADALFSYVPTTASLVSLSSPCGAFSGGAVSIPHSPAFSPQANFTLEFLLRPDSWRPDDASTQTLWVKGSQSGGKLSLVNGGHLRFEAFGIGTATSTAVRIPCFELQYGAGR